MTFVASFFLLSFLCRTFFGFSACFHRYTLTHYHHCRFDGDGREASGWGRESGGKRWKNWRKNICACFIISVFARKIKKRFLDFLFCHFSLLFSPKFFKFQFKNHHRAPQKKGMTKFKKNSPMYSDLDDLDEERDCFKIVTDFIKFVAFILVINAIAFAAAYATYLAIYSFAPKSVDPPADLMTEACYVQIPYYAAKYASVSYLFIIHLAAIISV